ncbi:MAG: glycosyltransferase family 2 protein [Anaerolineae bacterium]|nr:glycosyltransferase family 2 protein [Anaerolineae bacterium]MCB0212565.1 glycosyltransferase family 2 protein [Anaerolineae bacterium]
MPISSNTTPAISVIMPAYYEEAAIASVIKRVQTVLYDLDQTYEIIVVDDGSQDGTARRAHEAGARVIVHPYNIGNGAAVKSGIRHAQGEILVMLDADGQHPPEDIPRLLSQLDRYDMVVGARTHESDSDWHRDLANRIYNWFASYVCGRKIDDLTSGFRAMKGHIARGFVYLLPNTFSYPTTLTLAVVRSGYTLRYVPIKAARRVGKSKIKLFKDGPRFLLIILKVATFFSPLKVFIPASIAMFSVGIGYGLVKVLFFASRYGPTSAMLMTVAVLVFLVGLVSEQVAQLRFEVREREGTQEHLPVINAPFNHTEKSIPEKEIFQ